MNIDKKKLEKLANWSQSTFVSFVTREDIIEEYGARLPEGYDLADLRIRFDFVDVRLYAANPETPYFRVACKVFLENDRPGEAGSYLVIFGESGEVVDEFLEIY